MATRNRAIVVTKWKTEGSNQPAIIDDAPNGVSITDIVGQPDDKMPPTPNVYICEVDNLTNAQLTALKGINRYMVLMDESYDNVTNEIIASNYDDVPTAQQLINFIDQLKLRFTGIDDDKLTRFGRSMFRAERTRREILQELIDRWKGFDREPII